ncbi:MAG: RepB family protein, partial [Sphaerospermopsis kisseleviana]
FPQIEIMKSNVRQINIRCSNASKIKVDQLCQEHKLTQSQLIEKLIENFQHPVTENNDQIAELEGRLADQKARIEELELMLDKQAVNATPQTSTGLSHWCQCG